MISMKLLQVFNAQNVIKELRAKKLPIHQIYTFKKFIDEYDTYLNSIEEARINLVKTYGKQLYPGQEDFGIDKGSEEEKMFFNDFSGFLNTAINFENVLVLEMFQNDISLNDYNLIESFLDPQPKE